MIGLQRRKRPHDLVMAELDVIASRIEALRVLYTKLYLVDHQAEINFCDYLRELCRSLLNSHLPQEKSIEFDIECTPVKVHLDRSRAARPGDGRVHHQQHQACLSQGRRPPGGAVGPCRPAYGPAGTG